MVNVETNVKRQEHHAARAGLCARTRSRGRPAGKPPELKGRYRAYRLSGDRLPGEHPTRMFAALACTAAIRTADSLWEQSVAGVPMSARGRCRLRDWGWQEVCSF